jgi:midasin (ATPase involved in ribosome maturation)
MMTQGTKNMTTLKPRQSQFIQSLANAGLTSPLTFAQMQEVCDSSGLYKMPPSWITHDSDRKVSRGLYAVPEISNNLVSPVAPKDAPVNTNIAPAPVTKENVDIQTGPVQGAVEQPALTAASLVMGMTGGERQSLVPPKFDGYVSWGHFNNVVKIVKSRNFYPIFITGLSGNGKTLMVEQVCAKLKRECYRVNITRQTDEDDLLGGFRLINGNTVWQDGPVVSAMKSGGVLLLDEVDLGSANIMCLQPVLEGKGVFLKKIGQWITPAAGFTVFATANTKGKGSDDGRFVGTGVMNEAFLDRFPITMEQPYATKATEKKILTKAGCVDADFADNLTKWAEIIRKTFYEGGIDEVISTRRLVNIVEAFGIFGDKRTALDMCMSRFDDLTKKSLIDLYEKVDADMPVEDETAVSADGNKCPF